MEIDFFLRKCLLSLEHDLTAQVNGCSWTVSFAFLINAECFFAVKKLFIFVLPVEEIKKVLFFTAIVIACTLTQCEWMQRKCSPEIFPCADCFAVFWQWKNIPHWLIIFQPIFNSKVMLRLSVYWHALKMATMLWLEPVYAFKWASNTITNHQSPAFTNGIDFSVVSLFSILQHCLGQIERLITFYLFI